MDIEKKYIPLIKIVILFIVFFIIGYIVGLRGEKQNINLNYFNNYNSISVFIKIISRNTIAFILLFSSMILGEKLIYFFYGLNSYLIGIVIGRTSLLLGIIVILPHGILEMISFVLAGYYLIRYANTNDEKFIKFIKFIKLTYLGILIAAFIESFITPELALLVF